SHSSNSWVFFIFTTQTIIFGAQYNIHHYPKEISLPDLCLEELELVLARPSTADPEYLEESSRPVSKIASLEGLGSRTPLKQAPGRGCMWSVAGFLLRYTCHGQKMPVALLLLCHQ